MPKKAANSNPFNGRWRIVSISVWDQKLIDEEGDGYFEFDQKNNGQFHFGHAHGQMDLPPNDTGR
jgi:hypothetical protein